MFIMESTGKKKPRPRRSFTPESKTETAGLCRRGGRSAGQLAEEFDLAETAVGEVEVDAGERDGLTSSEREELAALQRGNRRLREDAGILRRATVSSTRQRNSVAENPQYCEGLCTGLLQQAISGTAPGSPLKPPSVLCVKKIFFLYSRHRPYDSGVCYHIKGCEPFRLF